MELADDTVSFTVRHKHVCTDLCMEPVACYDYTYSCKHVNDKVWNSRS